MLVWPRPSYGMAFRLRRADAVFFDLDDTLADTLGTLVGPALQQAAARMVAAGLDTDESTAAEFMWRLAEHGEGADYFAVALERFGSISGGDSAIIEIGPAYLLHYRCHGATSSPRRPGPAGSARSQTRAVPGNRRRPANPATETRTTSDHPFLPRRTAGVVDRRRKQTQRIQGAGCGPRAGTAALYLCG